jgi:acetoin utilization protein AcuB
MIASDVMTREPYAASSASSIGQVMRMLAEADVRHLPIVEDEALVGMVSDRDLRGVIPSALDELERPREVQRMLARPISTLMSSNVVCVHPETDLAEIVDLMVEERIGAVPVVEADSLKLMGIVSYVDALRAARDML